MSAPAGAVPGNVRSTSSTAGPCHARGGHADIAVAVALIDRSKTRVLAMLNIVGNGMLFGTMIIIILDQIWKEPKEA